MAASPEEKEVLRLGSERRDKIRDLILDLVTGDLISTAELKHFRAVSDLFKLPERIDAITDASNSKARLELMVAVMLTAAELAIDDTPRQSRHQLEKEMLSRYAAISAKPKTAPRKKK